MIRQRMTIRFAILFLLLGTCMAWSQRQQKRKDSTVTQGAPVPSESKISPRYSDSHKGYILHEDDQEGHHGKGAEEYLDSEDQSSHKEQEEALGNEELDKTVKDDQYDDHSEKGGHHRFEAGGASFDKHLKDHKADNKEVENVKQHDVGEKFGGQATKEHKLGKHKEKSKGHKLHGFKNVYHKEEYGDHKTFHDEFLDADHQHNYDDQHEHQEMEGGKFSKGFKHEGKNKKFDKGDEKHEWGKEEYDSQHEGKHEKGGQSSKHRHGSKKHQGQYDANAQRNKNSVHKVKKGSPPPYVHHAAHHGPHQAQIQPYVHQYNSHHEHTPSHQYKPQTHSQSHHVHYDDDKYRSTEDNGGHYQNHEGHHSKHGSHAHKHGGGHHDNDQTQHYSHDDVDNESNYQERTPHSHHHRSHSKEQLDDKKDDRIVHRHEPVSYKQSHYTSQPPRQPVYIERQPVYQEKQPVYQERPVHQERQPVIQERQPVYQERSHFKQPEYSRQDKISHPFNERSHNHNHRIRYGFQPRNHHHHSHHQHQNPHQQQLQPFPRFSGFNHHHNHHHHKNHFRPVTSHHQQESTPDVHAHKTEHTSVRPSIGDHRRISQKHYE